MSEPLKKIEAVVAAKEGVYDELYPEMDPHGDPVFKVAFETPEGVKIFWVNSIEYYRLEVGQRGMLAYEGNDIVSFGQWIHRFKV